MPQTPMPLLLTAPIVPATCVPWLLGGDLRIMAAEVVAAGALSVAPDIRCQIGMRIVDAAVHHGDDDVFMSGADAPCRKNVEVGHGRRSDRSAHPVVNPLIDQQRIIESGDCDIVRT